jgi:hypothetical protein
MAISLRMVRIVRKVAGKHPCSACGRNLSIVALAAGCVRCNNREKVAEEEPK